MPGRKYQAASSSKYPFSINGQLKENDLNDNITSALYWEYDSRIGRRWNVDPKPNISLSSYVTFANNPICNTDLLGDSLPRINFEFGNYEYSKDGTLGGATTDFLKIFPNIAGDIGNGAISLVNTVTYNINYVSANGIGNYQDAVYRQWSQSVSNFATSIQNSGTYLSNTPLSQQATDLSMWIGSPETWQGLGTGYVSGKLLGGFSKPGLKYKGSLIKLDPAAQKLPITLEVQPTMVQQWQSLAKGGGNTVKASTLKLTHPTETIIKSADYVAIQKLSDQKLIESVLRPSQYDPVRINSKTGKLFDGNTRIYEIQRRGLDVDVPVKYYTPDDSPFIN